MMPYKEPVLYCVKCSKFTGMSPCPRNPQPITLNMARH